MEELLHALIGGEKVDWNVFVDTAKRWNVNIDKIVAEAKSDDDCCNFDITTLNYHLYRLHAEDVLEWIKELFPAKEEVLYEVVDIYPDYQDYTEYEGDYDFWYASSKEELVEKYKDEVMQWLKETGNLEN